MKNTNVLNSLCRAIVEDSIKAVVCQFTLVYLIPLGTPVTTVLIGYFTGLPWFWIWLGTLASFAFISIGLSWFNQWLYLCRIEDKLALESIVVGSSIKKDGFFIGLRLNNRAHFPLEFQVTEIRTRILDKVPLMAHQPKQYIIPPNGVGWYNDNVITISILQGTIEGLIEYKIHYGKKGRLQYVISGKKQIVASFNDGLLTNYTWNDFY